MIRYKEKTLFNMEQAPDGVFILHSDAMQAYSDYLQFVFKHADDIEKGVDDFGDLKPMLEMVRGIGSS